MSKVQESTRIHERFMNRPNQRSGDGQMIAYPPACDDSERTGLSDAVSPPPVCWLVLTPSLSRLSEKRYVTRPRCPTARRFVAHVPRPLLWTTMDNLSGSPGYATV